MSPSEWWHKLWVLEKDSVVSVAIDLSATRLEA